MIALDTNVLVYARRAETKPHRKAKALLARLAEGEKPWALAWLCIYEYLRVVTHARVFDPPTDLDAALDDLESLVDSPSLVLLGEGSGHRAVMKSVIRSARPAGNLIHDAHIAALMIEHGVRELRTLDRDFTRFHGLRVRYDLE